MFIILVSLLASVLNSPAQAALPTAGVYLNSDGAPIISILENVQHTLDIEIYTMADPEFRQLLRKALANHIQVRILKDPTPYKGSCNVFGTDDSDADCADQQKLVTDVRAAGGTYAAFNKGTLCPNGGGPQGQSCFEHGKIAIADGQVALISTGNFDDTNLCIASENPSRCNRDFSVIETDSTIISTLQSIFEKDLQGQSYDVRTLIPASLKNTLTVSPYSLQPILDLIKSASTSVEVETQYLEDPEMNAALVAAAKHGITVSVTTASLCSFGTPLQYAAQAAEKTYSAFDAAGISTAMFNASNLINGHAGYLHAKVIIIDGTTAWVGSENGSTTSLTENREYGIIFDDSSWVSSVESIVRADHASSDSETWQDSLTCKKDGANPDPQPLGQLPPPKPKPHKKKPTPSY